MPKITVLAGDFLKKEASFNQDKFQLYTNEHSVLGEAVSISKILTIEVATEESVKRVGGTVGWGVAGAVALGGIGLIAGLVLGGKGKDVSFVAEFVDGRRLLATTDSKTFALIQAAHFDTPKRTNYEFVERVPESVKGSSKEVFSYSNVESPQTGGTILSKAYSVMISVVKVSVLLIAAALMLPLVL